MPVVGGIAGAIATMGVSAKAARALAWVVLIIAAALLVWLAWSAIKSNIIGAHDAKVRAGNAGAQLDRQAQADSDEAPRRKADQAADDRMGKVIDNAVDAHPEAARGPVGPATRATLDELRRRQEPAPERR